MNNFRIKLNNYFDNKKRRNKLILVLLTIIISLSSINVYSYFNKPEEITYNKFLQQVENDQVGSVYINDKNDTFEFKDLKEKKFVTQNPKTENFKEFLLLNDINVVNNKTSTYLRRTIDILRFTLLIGFMFLLIAKMGLGSLKKQKSLVSVEPLSKFKDVAGHVEVKGDMVSLVGFLKNPDKYYKMGAKLPKGVILTGPPGTGKTLIARAIAGEANVPFFSISGSDFIEMFAGLGAKRVRELYKDAREVSPSIVFIDEIDAIGTHRTNGVNGEEKNQTINALLAELDGFRTDSPVVTIVATNRVNDLDKALVRPGRFDKRIAMELPDVKDRLAILNLYIKNKNIAEEVNIEEVAKMTIGFSGAALEALLNEAAIIAVDNNYTEITQEHIDDAHFKLTTGGHRKLNSIRNKDEVEIVAYHEAGHALMSKLISDNTIPKVTIIPSTTGIGGATSIIPKEKGLITKKELLNHVKILYAGRAAEYVLKNDEDEITSGASNDIKVATSYIKSYYSELGMSELGMLEITDEDMYMQSAMELSRQLYKETLAILEDNQEILKNIAIKLIDKETINEKELNEIIYK